MYINSRASSGITIAVLFSSTRTLSVRRQGLLFRRSLKGSRRLLRDLDKNNHVRRSLITVIEDYVVLCRMSNSSIMMQTTTYFSFVEVR